MVSTLEAKEMNLCQQAKDSVRNMMGRYLTFVNLCLYDERYTETMENLLPFDYFARAKLKLEGNEYNIKSLGISVMRMDFEPSVFSLGVSIEIAEGISNSENNTTILISACRTLEQLRDYVQTDNFEKVVRENFEKQIEVSFTNYNRRKMKKVSASLFFGVLWKGICQALGWFFGLFGYKRDGKYAKCVWGLFVTSGAIIMAFFTLAIVCAGVEVVYDRYCNRIIVKMSSAITQSISTATSISITRRMARWSCCENDN